MRVSRIFLQRIIINKISSIQLSARLVWAGVAERVSMDCIRERGACTWCWCVCESVVCEGLAPGAAMRLQLPRVNRIVYSVCMYQRHSNVIWFVLRTQRHS